MYKVKEIAKIAGVSPLTVYNKIAALKLKSVGIKNYSRVYSTSQAALILDNIKHYEIIRYYPLKTTETFYIYESKLNKD